MLNTIIGATSLFRGALEVDGLVRVDGWVSGSIDSGSGDVIVSENARCLGPIKARSVVIAGLVKGPVFARGKVELLKGAVVAGDIIATCLSAEEGAVIHGDCVISGTQRDDQAFSAFIRDHGGFPETGRDRVIHGGN